MAIGDISLTASARANLMALQGTAKLLGQTQAHLSSGKKVSSALDNATSFFASQGFLNSANDLAGLKDSMSTALQTIKAASDAITSIKNIVDQLKGITNSAAQSQDATTRAGLAAQYNDLLGQLDDLANDATFNGTNLVNSLTSSLKVNFNADNTTSLTIRGNNLTSTGLGVGGAVGGFADGVLAKQVVSTLTVADTNTTLSNVAYSGAALSNLTVTNAVSTIGNGAQITSDYTVTATGAVNGGAVVVGGGGAANSLYANALAALDVTGVTATTVKASTAVTQATGSTSVVISGQFSVEGGAAATLEVGATESTKITAGATDDTGLTVTVGAGQTVQVTRFDGTNEEIIQYTNTTANDITFTSGATTDTVSTLGTLAFSGPEADQTIGNKIISNTSVTTHVGTDAAVAGALVTTGAVITAHGTGATANDTLDAIGLLVGAGLTATTAGDAGAVGAQANQTLTITGQFTATTGVAATLANGTYTAAAADATGIVITIDVGQTIQVLKSDGVGGADTTLTNYTNTGSVAVSITLQAVTDTVAANSGTQVTYAANSTASYALASGTVATTGVTLSNSASLNGNDLVDSLEATSGAVTTHETTAAAAGETAGTTTATGVTAYDVGGATITGISGTGIIATQSGTGAITYGNTNADGTQADVTMSLSGVKTLGGSSVTTIDEALNIAQDQLASALLTLRTAGSSLGNNNTLVQTRQDFTNNLISTLQNASDNLILADTNEEGANMQALQAQNQLGIVSLSISGQLAQSILKLF